MAYAITSAVAVRLTPNVESAGTETVKNDGPGSVVITKNPVAVANAADAFVVAAAAQQEVWLRAGEALYAICPAGQTASLEVI